MMEMVEREYGIVRWSEKFPELRRYWEGLGGEIVFLGKGLG